MVDQICADPVWPPTPECVVLRTLLEFNMYSTTVSTHTCTGTAYSITEEQFTQLILDITRNFRVMKTRQYGLRLPA